MKTRSITEHKSDLKSRPRSGRYTVHSINDKTCSLAAIEVRVQILKQPTNVLCTFHAPVSLFSWLHSEFNRLCCATAIVNVTAHLYLWKNGPEVLNNTTEIDILHTPYSFTAENLSV